MAHQLKVEFVPGKNKNGSPSKTRGIWKIYDRTRRGKVFLGQTEVKGEVPDLLDERRRDFIQEHLANHPNDMAFRRKHKIEL